MTEVFNQVDEPNNETIVNMQKDANEVAYQQNTQDDT